jgi:hypothetical protein
VKAAHRQPCLSTKAKRRLERNYRKQYKCVEQMLNSAWLCALNSGCNKNRCSSIETYCMNL